MPGDMGGTYAAPGWMRMAGAAAGIVGKTVAHVVVKRRPEGPRGQVLLVFTDGTYYEFFSSFDAIVGASTIDVGGLEAARACGGTEWIVLQAPAPVTRNPAKGDAMRPPP